jgi:hypothetical protein
VAYAHSRRASECRGERSHANRGKAEGLTESSHRAVVKLPPKPSQFELPGIRTNNRYWRRTATSVVTAVVQLNNHPPNLLVIFARVRLGCLEYESFR